jgi:hypothetical protein
MAAHSNVDCALTASLKTCVVFSLFGLVTIVMVERWWRTGHQQRQRAHMLQSERCARTPLHPAGIAAHADPRTGRATYATADAWRCADDAGRESLWSTFTAGE